MKRKLFLADNIVTANSKNEVMKNFGIETIDGIISSFINLKRFDMSRYNGQVIDFRGFTLIPGFVQTHVHLCQTLFRGYADDLELLDWLQKRIFPFENAHSKKSLRVSAQLGLNDLLTGGTTTILDMGTLHFQEIIFEELIKSGIRAYAGNCMVDVNNLCPEFQESTEWNLKSTLEWAKAFHRANDEKIKYGFAPRFVLSCSEKLLRDTREIMKDFPNSIFHTHSSENKQEIEAVRKQTGKENIDYLNSIGLLDSNSVLAHCIHINENEVSILKNNFVRVAHCPSANMKLGSGIANIPKLMKEGISVSIGADGAPCNNNLSIFNEMKLAALLQKPLHGPTAMNALTVFRLATIEGAKALHMDEMVGSIEVGKKADFVFLDLNKTDQPISYISKQDENSNQIYSSIVYSASKENVMAVFIDGKKVVDKGKCINYDQEKLLSDGKNELKKIMANVNSN